MSTLPPTICFPFVGDLIGGSHISALGLISALDRTRFRPLVLVQQPRGRLATLFAEAGIAVEQAPPSVPLGHGTRINALEAWQLAGRFRALAAYLRARDVSIVHTNDGRSHATWAVPARLAGAKLIWHHRGSPKAWGRRFVAPFLAHEVISVSAYANGHPAFGARGTVIHSPFDPDGRHDSTATRASLFDELKLRPSAHLIGFCGALIARKRPLLFVEVLALARQLRPDLDAQGLIFGEALDVSVEQLRSTADRLGVADALHLLGFREPGAVWIGACDALLVPAVDEPFGRTLIEAMLARVPIVAGDSGGNSEALRGGRLGSLVPAEDKRAMAEALIRLFDDAAYRRSMIERARSDAVQRFSLQGHAEQVMAIYDRLLSVGAGGIVPASAEAWAPR